MSLNHCFERDSAYRADRPYADGPLITELDELGNPYRITKPDGCEIETTFDAMNRMVERRSTSACPPGAAPIDERFGYDARGNLVAAQNAHVGLIREYDALDRLTREIDDRFGSSVAYLYDDASRLTTRIYPDSSIVQLSYDAAGRAIGITDSLGTGAAAIPGGDTTRYAYDAAGRRVESVSTSGLRTRLTYDENGRINAMTGYRTNGTIATSLVYPSYDNAGNRTEKADGTGTTAYAYDELHRLVAETPPVGAPVHYAYDRAGNRTHSGHQVGGAWASPYVTYDYDDATTVTHRLLSATTDAAATLHAFPAYDANGNPTQWNDGAGLRTLTWDALDRLVAIGGAYEASYAYDPFGRRIEKTEEGVTRLYQYDGLDPVAEYAAAGSPTATYLFGPGIDEPLKIKRGTLLAAYHGDGLGSVTAVSKMGGNASLQVTYRYDAFGETTVIDTFENAYAFTGRELDGSGLYYYRARYYLPAVGRFLTPDPIGLAGGSHPYVYVSSNPVNFRDPFGLRAAATQSGPVSNAATPSFGPAFAGRSASQSRYPFSIPTVPGAGTVSGGLFIQNPRVALFGHGDARGVDANATPDQFRVFLEANFETGKGFLQSNPSCVAVVGCAAPLPFNTPGSPNKFTVNPTANGFLLGVHAANAQDRGGLLGEIDADFFVQANGSRAATGVAILEPFPSAQLFQFQGNRTTELLRFTEDALGPEFFGIPNLEGDRTVVPFTNIPVR